MDNLKKIVNDFPNGSNKIQQCIDEIQQVKDYLGDRKFSNFCEVGCSWGGSLWIYANLLVEKFGSVTAIQINKTFELGRTYQALKDRGFYMSSIMQDSLVELLHIDADHEYESVKRDFEAYYPLVVSGGVILLHDTLLWDGCIRLRRELEKKFDCRTFKGHNLLSGTFSHPDPTRNSTGITLINVK